MNATILHSLAEQLQTEYKDEGRDPFAPDLPMRQLLLAREATRRLCWLSMTYRCDGCGYRYQVYCALGVEGPPALKEAGLYLPCAFMHRCPTGCGGTSQHVAWQDDQELAPLRIAPDDAPWFHLPEIASTNGGAELAWPEAAIVAARRWYHEEGPGERLL